MNTSSISRLRTSITAAPRPRARKPMESVSASIALYWMNSIASPSARRSITRATSCRPTWTPGCSSTTIVDRIRAAGASARPRCRPSLTQSHWRRRNSWPPEDTATQAQSTNSVCQTKSRLLHLLRDDIAATYARDLPSAVACLDDDFEACIAHLRFPLGHRRVIRTTNLLERLFGEERRRTKVIPHAFGERAVLKLIYAALIRAAERWRGIRITEFEQRQLKVIRDEIHKNFAERNAPAASPTVTTEA